MSDLTPNKPSFWECNSVQKLFIRHWRFLILGIYLPLLLFAILALKVWESPSGLPWDLSILSGIYSTRYSQLETPSYPFNFYWYIS